MKQANEPSRYTSTVRQRVIRAASLWLLLLLAFILLRIIYLRFNFGIPCPLYSITGLFCPGCGMFRAIGALSQAAILQAVRYNALALILLPVLAIYCIRDTIRYIQATPPSPASRAEMILIVGLVAVSMLYAALRNLPYFEILRPESKGTVLLLFFVSS